MDGARLQFPVLSTNTVQKTADLSGIPCIEKKSWIIVCWCPWAAFCFNSQQSLRPSQKSSFSPDNANKLICFLPACPGVFLTQHYGHKIVFFLKLVNWSHYRERQGRGKQAFQTTFTVISQILCTFICRSYAKPVRIIIYSYRIWSTFWERGQWVLRAGGAHTGEEVLMDWHSRRADHSSECLPSSTLHASRLRHMPITEHVSNTALAPSPLFIQTSYSLSGTLPRPTPSVHSSLPIQHLREMAQGRAGSQYAGCNSLA